MKTSATKLGVKLLTVLLTVTFLLGMAPLTFLQSEAAYYGEQLKFNSNHPDSAEEKFVILVLADIQDDENVDGTTLELIRKCLQKNSPDLVVFTGDNTKNNCNDFLDGKNNVKASIQQFLTPIVEYSRATGKNVPFMVTFGNHDSEGVLDASRSELYGFFQDYGGGLMINHDNYASSVDMNGVGNGYSDVYSSDGSEALFRVFVMDSGDYDSNDEYDACYTNQIDYYQANAGIPHMWFQHIIVPDIYTTGILASDGITAGTTYTGDGKTWTAYQGRKDFSDKYYVLDADNTLEYGLQEQPCPAVLSNYTSSAHLSTDGKTLYEAWKANLPNMKGAFFGHDHKNFFLGVDDNGVAMGGCKAATYNSYNDGDAGCRVITVEPDGSYTSETQTVSSFAMTEPVSSTLNDIEHTLNIPPVIYAGAAGNGVAKQEFASEGNSFIQTHLLDQETKLLSPADLDIDFELEGATDFELTVSPGVTYSVVTSAPGVFKAVITGGTCTVGEPIEYELKYNVDGASHTRLAYSCVNDISSTPGYYIFTRQYRNGAGKEFCSNQYVVTLSGINDGIYTVFGESRDRLEIDPATEYAGSGTFNGTSYGDWSNKAGYYNFTTTGDGGFIDMGSSAHNYAMNYFSPVRSLSTCHWKRNTTAGQSPVANIYVDESTVREINDLNLRLTYYIHTDTDSSLPIYIRPVGLFEGDTGYTHGATVTNYDYDRSFVPTAANYGEISANGITTDLTSGTRIIGINGYSAKQCASVKILGSGLPSNGDEYTLVGAAYSARDPGVNGSDDWPHQNYTYTPILLRFNVVNKAELRKLVNECRTADFDSSKSDHSAYINYKLAFKAACGALYKGNATDAEIEAVQTNLQASVDLIETEITDISAGNSEAVPSASSFPEKLYVAQTNTLEAQTPGTTIQTQVVNYHTRSMVDYDTDYSVTLPDGTTSAALTAKVFTPEGVENGTLEFTQNFNTESTTIAGSITGGTASNGDYVMYNIEYVLGGVTYNYIQGSYIANIPIAVGWYVNVRDDDGTDASNGYLQSIAPTNGFDINSTVFAPDNTKCWSYGDNTPSATTNPVGYYNLAAPELGDGGFVTYNNSNADRSGYVYWSPGAGDKGNWYCGRATSNADSDGGYRSYALLSLDSSRLANLASAQLSQTVMRTACTTPVAQMTNSQSKFFSGVASLVDGAENNFNSLSFIGFEGAGDALASTDNGTSITKSFTSGASGGLPVNGAIVTYQSSWLSQGGTGTQAYECETHTGIEIRFAVTNGAILRNAAQTQRNINRALADGYTEDSFNAYLKALAKASAFGMDPRNTPTVMNSVNNELAQAVTSLGYVEADYEGLYDALDTVVYDSGTENGLIDRTSGLYTGELYVRASAANSFKADGVNELYFKGAAATPNNGAYLPSMYVADAGAVVDSIGNRAAVYASGSVSDGNFTPLDCRYQNIIDSYAASLLESWNATLLKSCDYSVVNAYTAKYLPATNENGMKSQTYFDFAYTVGTEIHTLSKFFPADNFVKEPAYDAWESANAGIVEGYKLPHAATVAGYATALTTAYSNLALRFAGEYYEGSYEIGGVTYTYSQPNLADTKAQWTDEYETANIAAAALKPGTAETLTVNLYTSSTWEAFKTAYETARAEYAKDYSTPANLRAKIPAADTVEAVITGLSAQGNALQKAPANLTYLNGEIESVPHYAIGGDGGRTQGGAYYYTAQTWGVYEAALNAATASAVAESTADKQAEINALALELYNARNALELKALDHSAAQAALLAADNSGYLDTVEVLVNPSLAQDDPARTEEKDVYTQLSRTTVVHARATVVSLLEGAQQDSLLQPALESAVSVLESAVEALEVNPIYNTGWNFIASNLGATYNDSPVTMENLYDYYAQYIALASLQRIADDTAAKALLTTALEQEELNTLTQGLYDYLNTAVAEYPELAAAKLLAANERDRTIFVDAPNGLGGMVYNYYSSASIAECTAALDAITVGTIYASTPENAAARVALAHKTAGVGGETETLLVPNTACYYYVDELIAQADEGLDDTVEVVDPTGGDSRFVNLYGTADNNAARQALEQAIAAVDKSLTVAQQDTVNGYASTLFAASESLEFGAADMTFVNAQLAILAALETGGSGGREDINGENAGAYFYTPETWGAYVTAKQAAQAAVSQGDTADNQAAVNTLALNLFNARNGLELKALGSVEYATITVQNIGSYVFNGEEIKPSVTVTLDGNELDELIDYTVDCSNNINAGEAFVTITGVGNYSGFATTSFTIAPADISAATIDEIATQTFTGSAITPAVTAKINETGLASETDFTVAYLNNTNAGDAQATITGCGNYIGSKSVSFTITPADASGMVIAEISDISFSGLPLTPPLDITFGGNELVLDKDYTAVYTNNIVVGEATVTITGIGNFSGTTQTSFNIVLAPASTFTVLPIAPVVYNGTPQTPAVRVFFGIAELRPGVDYTVSCKNNTNAGSASVTITGTGNYVGTKLASFEITPAPAESLTIAPIADIAFDGQAKTPAVKVFFNEAELVENTDYTVAYSNNTNVGNAVVTVTGVKNFEGEKLAGFAIVPASAQSFTVSPIANAAYTGTAITPVVSVSLNGAPLAINTDYTVEYANNVEVGTATVTISGTGNYNGSITAEFEILPIAANVLTAQTIDDVIYTGRAFTPEPVVSFGGTVLTKDDDYTLAYSNNVEVGTATVTITGIGNFTGESVVYFNILSVPVDGVSLSNAEITINYKKAVSLSATVTPSNAGNRKVTWSSDNGNVASVDQSGNVTAKGRGTAKITATTQDGGFVASCTVKVKFAWWQWLIWIFLLGFIWY